MKPFNLEAAKAGKPICTREGKAVKFIAHIPTAREGYQVIIFNSEREIPYLTDEQGKFAIDKTEDYWDVFMEGEKKEG